MARKPTSGRGRAKSWNSRRRRKALASRGTFELQVGTTKSEGRRRTGWNGVGGTAGSVGSGRAGFGSGAGRFGARDGRRGGVVEIGRGRDGAGSGAGRWVRAGGNGADRAVAVERSRKSGRCGVTRAGRVGWRSERGRAVREVRRRMGLSGNRGVRRPGQLRTREKPRSAGLRGVVTVGSDGCAPDPSGRFGLGQLAMQETKVLFVALVSKVSAPLRSSSPSASQVQVMDCSMVRVHEEVS